MRTKSFTVAPIGYVEASRHEPIDDEWDAVSSAIQLDPRAVRPDALAGLGSFSHIEVIYLFHRVDPDAVQRGARRPRGNPAWPAVGILAQRAKNRPNRLGISTCRLLEIDDLRLHITGLDAIDGTPVLDVKPYFAEFGARGEIRQPTWSHELMRGYWRV